MSKQTSGVALWSVLILLAGAGFLAFAIVTTPEKKPLGPSLQTKLKNARWELYEQNTKLTETKEVLARALEFHQAAKNENARISEKTKELQNTQKAITVAAQAEAPKVLSKTEAFDLYKSVTVPMGSGKRDSLGFYYIIEEQIYVITSDRYMSENATSFSNMRVARKDTETGLVFLDPPIGTTKPTEPVRLVAQMQAEPKLGETVYSLGSGEQIANNEIPDNAISGTVITGIRLSGKQPSVSVSPSASISLLEGTVSTVDRHVLDRKFFQVSLPTTRTKPGAPIFNVDGKLVGVLAGNIEGVERLALAISTTELNAAIARFRPAVAQTSTAVATGNPAPVGNYRGREAASQAARQAAEGKTYPEGVFTLPVNISDKPTFEDGLFAGPDNKLVVWNHKTGIACYALGSMDPVWSLPMNEKFLLQCPRGSTWALRMSVQTAPAQIDLGTGNALKTFHRITVLGMGATYYPYGNEYLVTDADQFWFFDPQNSRVAASGIFNAFIFGRSGDKFYFWSPPSKLGYFDAEAVYKLTQKARGAQRFKVGEQVIEELNTFDAPGVSLPITSEGDCHVIPGTEKVICGRGVWEVGEDGVRRVGDIPTPLHSMANEDWFYGLFNFTKRGQPSLNVLTVSNSGDYALTQTHLIDLRTLKVVVELPFPSMRSGFLSSERYIYLMNSATDKVTVYEINALRRSQAAKP